jgi:N6-adenosine-specific RNA methylase IME4
MPIKELLEENAVLFLWVTSPMLEDAFKVIYSKAIMNIIKLVKIIFKIFGDYF